MKETQKKHLKPGVYHGARPVRSLPIFNHEYTVVVPKHKDRLDKNLRRKMRTVNGQRVLVSGAYKTNGWLKGKLADPVDVAALKNSADKLRLVSDKGSTAAAKNAAADNKKFKKIKYPGFLGNLLGKDPNSNSYARSQIEKLTKKKMNKNEGFARTPGGKLRVELSAITELTARIDARLQEFAEIPLREGADGEGYYGWGPRIEVSRRDNPALHKLPNAGKACINYRVKRKTVDIDRDGKESYGTDIEVDTIEALPDAPMELSAILDSYDFAATAVGEVYPSAKKLLGDPIVRDQVLVRRGRLGKNSLVPNGKLARKKAVGALKHARKALGLRGFSAIVDSYDFEGRARDGGGRYAPGQNVSAGEMADAYLTKKKVKTAAVIGGGAGLATAAVLGRKKLSPRIGQAIGRMVMR